MSLLDRIIFEDEYCVRRSSLPVQKGTFASITNEILQFKHEFTALYTLTALPSTLIDSSNKLNFDYFKASQNIQIFDSLCNRPLLLCSATAYRQISERWSTLSQLIVSLRRLEQREIIELSRDYQDFGYPRSTLRRSATYTRI